MNPHLTVAYMTNRKEPEIAWFFDSFHRECAGNYQDLKLIVVDFWADEPGRREAVQALAYCPLTHVTPKPTVWQGKYKLTQIDYFAASNARNTALCLAPDGYLVFIDDLSVLLPGWLEAVRLAQSNGWIACGTYKKPYDLFVKKGEVVSCRITHSGFDSRKLLCPSDEPIDCQGSWAYGCSIGMPVEALLEINGYDEDCDSMGSEDYIAGIMLQRNGYKLKFMPRMETYESEERHFIEPPFSRIIKKMAAPSLYIDSSHAILDWVAKGLRTKAPNYQNMRETRDKVLAGEPFPIIQCPEHDWRDHQPLKEMYQRT